jgi:hypothetical protein
MRKEGKGQDKGIIHQREKYMNKNLVLKKE